MLLGKYILLKLHNKDCVDIKIYLKFKEPKNDTYKKNDFSTKALKCLISLEKRGSCGNFHKMF